MMIKKGGRRLKWRKNYVAQVDESDCAVAAVSMILKYFGTDVPISRLRSIAKTDTEGTSVLGIVKVSDKMGIQAKAVKANKNIFSENNDICPFIIHIVKNQSLLHYYVVTKIKNNTVFIADPDDSVGMKKMEIKDLLKEWTGIAVLFSPKENYTPQREKQPSLFSYKRLLKNHKFMVNVIIFSSIIAMCITIIGTFIFQILIDVIVPRRMINSLTIISVGLILGYIISSFFKFITGYLTNILSQEMSKEIVKEYVSHILNLSMEFFSTRKNGDIVSRFTDTSKIVDAIASLFVSTIVNILVLFFISFIMALQNIQLFAISMLCVPIYMVAIVSFIKPFNKLNYSIMEQGSKTNSIIIDSVSGIETIKAMGWENKFLQKISKNYNYLLVKSREYIKLDQLQQTLKFFIDSFFSVLVLFVGAKQVLGSNLSLGELISFNALLQYFTTPLQELIGLQPKVQAARIAAIRLNEVMSIPTESNSNTKNSIADRPDIRIEGLSFKYGFSRSVIDNLYMTIPFGEKLIITGESGCGKSTLAKLIVGLLKKDKGSVKINEIDISNLSNKIVREAVTYVPKRPTIFNGTLLENLINNKYSNKQELIKINEVCSMTGIDKILKNFPLGLETNLGEQGTLLSGGQKQRICLARALLTDAKIIVLDEATSSLDIKAEMEVMEKVFKLNKTIICIAHRLDITSMSSRTIVLKNGKYLDVSETKNLKKICND